MAVARESVAPQQITPEMRGDIQMARKMFREAVESYSKANTKSAIIVNKIGIAYHQMLELDIARKYYEQAIKIDSKYAEAINNLGTVHYAKKSFRRERTWRRCRSPSSIRRSRALDRIPCAGAPCRN